ncbi:MAG: YdcF family protein [Clostridiaceae bacterium]
MVKQQHRWALLSLVMILMVIGIVVSPSIWMVLVVVLIWGLLVRQFAPGVLRSVIVLGLIYVVILESAVLLFMIKDRILPDPIMGHETIVVPGAGIRGQEPDLYLKLRLDGALLLLQTNPAMTVIVSGWQAQDEVSTEARVMKNYLIRQGISASRILEEPKGQDTIRNFEYSAELLRAKGSSPDIIIVTNNFHSFRSAAIARSLGLNPISVPVSSPGFGLIKYLVREVASLAKIQLHFGFSLH